MTRLSWLAFAVALALGGCDSSPRLDTSSDEAMTQSLEKMKAGLNETERQDLTKAIARLVLPRLEEKKKLSAFEPDSAQVSQAELLQPYSGLTARQLIARAKEGSK
jgi:hypothetical protein